MAFAAVDASANVGPPLSSHSGYALRRHATGRTVWERVFLVLFEHELWAYQGRRHWTARAPPLEPRPTRLDELRLAAHGPTAAQEAAASLKQAPQLPRHALMAVLRKQVAPLSCGPSTGCNPPFTHVHVR
jgi:hypothetical protein